jgi:uncharacterized membrane protein HdeD (DUF308 family)
MSSSYGGDPLAPNPIGSTGFIIQTYTSGHLYVLGTIDVIAGLIALIWPSATITVLALIFGIMLLLGGVMVILVGSLGRRDGGGGGGGVLTWVVGIVAVVAGLICIIHPGVGVWAIALGCSLWFLLTGIGSLLVAAASPAHRILFIILGVLSIAAAIILLVNPDEALATVAIVAGIAFLIRGIGELVIGWQLRKASA